MSGAPLSAASGFPGALRRRPTNSAGFLICAALLVYAGYAQLKLGLDPCPLCIFQRIGIAALGVVFLIAALHNPHSWGARVYAVLIAIAALATVAVAARQLYIQHLPPGAIPSCGAPLSMMMKFMPLTTVIRRVLTGSGECGVVNWRFLHLAMPAWVLLWAAFLGAAGVIANARRS
ncbi:MAG TPA: disulfide bond formation protein B [Steroidobacteraceae bacterium]|nr:disulfide bond formation protein B [Steroidobacteraceae bacterium]